MALGGAAFLVFYFLSVVCDESGQTKFPFSYLKHATLLTLAQAQLSPYSGFAQAGSPLLTSITIFQQTAAQPTKSLQF